MKKIIIVALIVLSKSWATNAQQLNISQPEKEIAAAVINSNKSQNLSLQNELQLNPDPEPLHDKAYFMQKSRNNRIASICLAGGGLIIAGIGALSFPKDYDLIFENEADKERKADGATTVIIVGCAVMLSSIPFTVMASVNKRRANAMVSNQKTGSGVVPPGVAKKITGITITLPIGK